MTEFIRMPSSTKGNLLVNVTVASGQPDTAESFGSAGNAVLGVSKIITGKRNHLGSVEVLTGLLWKIEEPLD